jgi:hypothetical protein
MTDADSPMQVRAGSEATRSRGGKGKAVTKGSKAESSSQTQGAQKHAEPMEAPRVSTRQPDPEGSHAMPSRDPQLISRIQQRAYVLFQACGCEHGHDLEHWLEAARQITGSLEHSDR